MRRTIERRRIEHALRSEAGDLDLTLFYVPDGNGVPQAGALAMVPRSHAAERFGSYGRLPMFIGFLFGFEDWPTFAAVFGAIRMFGQDAGRNSVYGPVEATINHSIGLLEGAPAFPISFLMPRNPAAWAAWFEASGFSIAQRLFTYELAFEKGAFHSFRRQPKMDNRLVITPLRTPFSEDERNAVVEVFNSGWQENWGFVPMEDLAVRELEREFRPILWDGLAYIARVGDSPAGIAIAVPDLNEISTSGTLLGEVMGAGRLLVRRRPRSVKLLILGLARPYHQSILGLNVIEGLIREIIQVADKRYRASHLQMGWTLESNKPINHIINRWAPNSARTIHSVWKQDL